MKKILDCFDYFNPSNTYRYLGRIHIPFAHKTAPWYKCVQLFEYLEDKLKPWWCPCWFLNLLYLYENDLKNKIINHFMITDMGRTATMRIYWQGGTKETADRIKKVADELDKYEI